MVCIILIFAGFPYFFFRGGVWIFVGVPALKSSGVFCLLFTHQGFSVSPIGFAKTVQLSRMKNDQLGWMLGLPPTHDSSHHQDYIFSRESRTKPSFATVTGWGVEPSWMLRFCFFCYRVLFRVPGCPRGGGVPGEP